jgi:2-dehydro-3-deoxyglucarate aldolase/4-hydroxy-2-oxoheptanedioate aldolase
LSQILGVTGEFEHPKCLKAIESIAQACARAGKPWGIFSRGPEYAVRMRDMGCQLFVLGADIHAMHAGIRIVKERYPTFFRPA